LKIHCSSERFTVAVNLYQVLLYFTIFLPIMHKHWNLNIKWFEDGRVPIWILIPMGSV